MKILLVALIFLVPVVSQAQEQHRPYRSKAKKVVFKQSSSTQLTNNKFVERLRVGDTCYVICKSVFLRVSPSNEEKTTLPPIALLRNAKVVVREILPTHWLLIDYFNLDVRVDGYLPRQSVSLKKVD